MEHMKTDKKEIFLEVKIKIINTIWFYFESLGRKIMYFN